MPDEKLARFLYFFYKGYMKSCLHQILAYNASGQSIGLDQVDCVSFLQKHIDIYVQHTELNKDYQQLYNTKLFYSSKAQEPELFNELEIFMIENFQLFCHSILHAALAKKYPELQTLKLEFSPIDNERIKLLDLVEDAENS